MLHIRSGGSLRTYLSIFILQTGVPTWKPFHVSVTSSYSPSDDPIKAFDCDFATNPADPTCKYAETRFSTSGQTCDQLGGREITHNFWGLQSGRFVNWMRTAGLPIFRKLYAKIDMTIPKGAKIRVNFVDNWHAPGVKKYTFSHMNEFETTST